ncbi:MAG: tetratricopeptide repeat protein, partial [Alphaproteobacteria bacterium]|nr:tetratricopeptide repeat protein [Alphaproteobacteria bacterium]
FDAHNNIGTVFRELNQFDEAIRSYKKAISIYPEYAEAFNNIGNIFKEQDQFDHAVDSYKMALSIDPYYFEAYFNLGVAHQKHGSSSDAINSYMKVLEINPEYVDAHNNLANIFQELGQIDKAINGYTKALKIDPTIAKIHRNLSILKKYKEVDSQILQMRDLISREKVDISDRINLYFALAKAYRDLGNKDELFKFLNKGNQLRKKQLNYSLKEDQDRHFSYRNFFESSSSVLTESLKFESTNVRPIFIIGMPRSGTTLLEQIFSSHTAVYGAGESVTLIKVISKLASKLLIDNTKLSKNNLQSIRQEYLNFLSSLDINESIITDKMPTNFEYIGFILKAIPEAKIIHIKRDPMATCWSIYFNYFSARGLGFPYSMDDLSGYYKSYINLMNYWYTAFPNKIYDISYEDLTVNQERETRKLLEYCELEWDENCLNFHNSQRSVKTASSIQVRKKMYQGSSEVWKQYEDYLQPLIKGLNYY